MSKKKKLLIIGSNSIHIYNFIELVKEYFDEVLLLTNQKNEKWKVNSIEVDFRLRVNAYKNYKNLQKIIDDFSPTTVHIHQINTQALLTIFVLKKYSMQKILTAWGSDILINPKKSLFLKWKAQYILNRVDIVTADSDIVLIEAQKLVKKTIETHNINFGIDISTCKGKKENIIYSNRLHNKLYNIDKIILSFSRFIKFNPSWKLIVAGIGKDTEKLKILVNSLNLTEKVFFVGWVDAKENYMNYCKSKIYVSIPSSDSISLSLVEAIAYNCVVFVSDLPANYEIIDEDIGFIEDNLKNINFEDYQNIKPKQYQLKRDKIVKKFSKSYNKALYFMLYDRVNL